MRLPRFSDLWKRKEVSPKPDAHQYQSAGSAFVVTPKVEVQVAPPEKAVSVGTPIYPPIDPGLLIDAPDAILATQHELIDLLRRNLGLPAHEFDAKYLAPLRRAAELINLLPATRDKHHAGAGGLFRLCCAMAVRSAQSAEGKIFAAAEGVERRRSAEQAWRHAAFLTGLVSELCRPLTEMLVIEPGGAEWSPFISTLTSFARSHNADRVFVRWHKRDDHRSAAKAMTSWAVNVVVGNEILSELHSVKPLIVETVFGVASGAITSADNSTMATLINDVRRRVIERDNELAPTTYGKLTQGAHLEPYLLDAMRSLIKSGKWKVNLRGSRCHWGSDGFFVAWRQGSEEMLEWLRSQNIEGIPNSRETLEDLLAKSGVITTGGENTNLHMVSAFGMQPFPCIRLQSPGSVVGNLDIKPVSNPLKVKNATAVSSQVSPQPSVGTVVTSKSKPQSTPATTPKAEDGVQLEDKNQQEPNNTKAPIGPIDQETGEIHSGSIDDQLGSAVTNETANAHRHVAESQQGPDAQQASRTTGGQLEARVKGKQPDRPEETLESLPADLLLELGAPACRDLALLRQRWNRGMDRAHLMKTPEGLAVAYQWLDSNMAMPWTKLQKLLQEAGHLKSSTVAGKQRFIVTLPFPKGDELGVVMLNAFLRKAGFEMDA